MSLVPYPFSRAVLSAAAAGLVLVTVAGCAGTGTPGPSTGSSSSSPAARPAEASEAPAPARLRVPSLGIDSALMRLGLNKDGTVEVPPAERGMTAGWYTGGAVPGEPGAAVLIGHNDTRFGRAVFHDLKDIAEGAEITVTGATGEEARFTVDSTRTVRKDAFPSQEVYGPSPAPVLRLVTCDGAFDSEGHPVDNLIVFATLS
ncbi:class F sortase [Streptomyces nitrosporeus]|uniref:class F sortase n=1 Tax=Streptomyces nitrosporeus TaxID=28894 RepID=UPI00332322BF